jgi:hypothetical protein
MNKDRDNLDFSDLDETDSDDLDGVSAAEELETHLKEVFLALYNLWMISRNHEEALKRIEESILSGDIKIVRTSQPKGEPAAASAQTAESSQENKQVSAKILERSAPMDTKTKLILAAGACLGALALAGVVCKLLF